MSSHHIEQSRPLLDDDGRQTPDLIEYPSTQTRADRRKRIIMKLVALAHPAHLTTLAKRFGYALVPSPIRSYMWDDHAPAPKQFPTSYLNGLRGVTAIKVFTFHYFMAFTDFTHIPWGSDDRHTNIMLLPIFRYFWTGFTSQMFFAIAGYLTCLRLFPLMDKNDAASQNKVYNNIVASLFRRGFRLYLPTAFIMFLMSTYIYTGLYEGHRAFIADKNLFPGDWLEGKPPIFPTFYEQMLYLRTEMFYITDITHPDTIYPEADQHLWSILAEMQASLHLYVCLVMLAACKRHIRLVGLCILTCLFCIWGRWATWIYLLGAIVAHVDIILTEKQKEADHLNLPATESEKIDEKQVELGLPDAPVPRFAIGANAVAKTRRHLRSGSEIALRYFFFLLSFYLMSWPIQAEVLYAPGYETLKYYIPEWMNRKDKIYPNIGGAILLFLLARSDPIRSKWRRFLSSRIPQYLGTVSFAMYLVHGPLMHMFGYMIPQHIWWAFGTQGASVGNTAWLGPILIGYSITLIASWAAADVWAREVEGRFIRFVKKLEEWCFKSKAS